MVSVWDRVWDLMWDRVSVGLGVGSVWYRVRDCGIVCGIVVVPCVGFDQVMYQGLKCVPIVWLNIVCLTCFLLNSLVEFFFSFLHHG